MTRTTIEDVIGVLSRLRLLIHAAIDYWYDGDDEMNSEDLRIKKIDEMVSSFEHDATIILCWKLGILECPFERKSEPLPPREPAKNDIVMRLQETFTLGMEDMSERDIQALMADAAMEIEKLRMENNSLYDVSAWKKRDE